uniref:CCT-beta n=1 Tax=Hucho hucho TaxID=62062 RepID=A0A4W5MF27_9TELE
MKNSLHVSNQPTVSSFCQIFGSRVRVDSTAKVAEIEMAEKEKMKEKVERILKHGINCFINRQLIYNYPEQLFAAAGVMAIEHADFSGVERLALVTGGEITSTFDHPELVKLGHCKLIEEVMIGEDTLIHFSGVAMGEACTVVLRGATQQILDEAERSLHDALCVLAQTVKETRTVYGGGCSEMLMAKVVTDLALRTPGKEAVAMESFAKALRMLPTIIADNAGYDSADLVAQLRAAHQEGKTTMGLNMNQGTIGDMSEMGVTESFQVKRQVLLSAAEAAEMILRPAQHTHPAAIFLLFHVSQNPCSRCSRMPDLNLHSWHVRCLPVLPYCLLWRDNGSSVFRCQNVPCLLILSSMTGSF